MTESTEQNEYFKHKEGCIWGDDLTHAHLVPRDCHVPTEPLEGIQLIDGITDFIDWDQVKFDEQDRTEAADWLEDEIKKRITSAKIVWQSQLRKEIEGLRGEIKYIACACGGEHPNYPNGKDEDYQTAIDDVLNLLQETK